MAMLSGPMVAAASGKTEALVVLVHGYGADGNDLIGLAPHLQQMMPFATFIAPNGPEPCAAQPMGYQWFPITRLDPSELVRGVERAAPLLNSFIDEQLATYGLDDSRLALVGFSQGTMMSLQVGLRRKKAPAAIVGYSGALAGADRLKDEITVKPPVLMVHGDADPMIEVSRMLDAVQQLGAVGLNVQWHISRNVGHGIDPEGLAIGGKFLSDAFAGRLASAAGAISA